ncbi:RNA polymerase sigma factor [Paraburkholderia sp. MMS20-SJTR3]|uniref:RNA polymerase sigma factor n=1 Tax=Paraburkholderia sejongensis TaxID=2886946 RepID=A0ABS8JZF9_9BURK|nr:RNA polymerase sigma factor [Paraburkholderia sp. MMS20-SJTR3]MCC8395291.1 RNA polymerase sigma factor [Paraburkholderia sp. MMS20-SJTR3]
MDLEFKIPFPLPQDCRADIVATNARFESAWRNVRAQLTRRARRLVRGDAEAADELLADTALKALLYMRRMPERIRNPEGFMFVVLNHVFVDRVRQVGREARVIFYCDEFDVEHFAMLAESAPSPTQTLESGEGLSLIASALDDLSANERRLFALKFEQELSYARIAGELQISEALARKRVELLRKKLRKAADSPRKKTAMGSRVCG